MRIVEAMANLRRAIQQAGISPSKARVEFDELADKHCFEYRIMEEVPLVYSVPLTEEVPTMIMGIRITSKDAPTSSES